MKREKLKVSIDTNVLTNILEHEEELEKALSFLEEDIQNCIYIPHAAFGEILDIEENTKLKFFRNLGRLMLTNFNQIQITRDTIEVFKYEIRNLPTKPKVVSRLTKQRFLDRLISLTDEEILGTYGSKGHLKSNKNKFYQANVKIRKQVVKEMSETELYESYLSYNEPSQSNNWNVMLSARFGLSVKDLVSNPVRYPSMYNFIVFEEYYLLSIAQVGSAKNKLDVSKKPVRHSYGGHYDSRIFAESTHSDVLLSKDSDFITRFNQLKEKKAITGSINRILQSFDDI